MSQTNYGHIAAIIVLVLVFFGLLILSTTNTSVDINYDLVDSIDINSYEDLNYIEVGEVVIENNGIISSRVDLEKFAVCQISDYYGDKYYEVNYRGAQTVQGKAELFSYDHYQRRVDVSPNEKIELLLSISPYSISKYNIEQYELYNESVSFYLFKVGDIDYIWDFCNSAKKEDAYKVILVNLDLEREKPLAMVPEEIVYER